MKLLPFLLASLGVLAVASMAQEPRAPAAPIVLLKLDDVVSYGKAPIPPRFQKVVDFLEGRGIKASLGIIGSSLEAPNDAYIAWLKAVQAKGHIEFWDHGYTPKKTDDEPQEFMGTAQGQSDSLRKTQTLAQEKLGFPLKGFGPHWSGTNAETEKALDTRPEITWWFALQPRYQTTNKARFAFERVMALENPTFVPDFEKFQATYEKVARGRGYLALQGHPNQWDDARWEGFVKIIDFLQAQGSVFMMPSEYLASVGQPVGK